MRKLSAPRVIDEARLKRAVRYLKGKQRVALRIPWHSGSNEVVTFVDSNFAGCTATRKSTTGGAIKWCGTCLKSWSRTQPTIALSSGEAELAAVVAGAAEGLGMLSLLRDFGMTTMRLSLKSDATAAIGITEREGLGKVRHLATADLWVQQRLRRNEFRISKVPGTENPVRRRNKRSGARRFGEAHSHPGIRHSWRSASCSTSVEEQRDIGASLSPLNMLLHRIRRFWKKAFRVCCTRSLRVRRTYMMYPVMRSNMVALYSFNKVSVSGVQKLEVENKLSLV